MELDRSSKLASARAQLLRAASGWDGLTQPNQTVEGLDVAELKGVAQDLLGLLGDNAADLEEQLARFLTQLPSLDFDYGETDREALIIKARVSDLHLALIAYQALLPKAQGVVSAPITEDIQVQLDTIGRELTAAREDLSALRRGFESASGITIQLGVVSFEVDAINRRIGEVLPSLAPGGAINLDSLGSSLRAIRDRVSKILSFVERQSSAFGKRLLELAQHAAARTRQAVVAGLEAFRYFLQSQLDERKVPSPSAVEQQIRANTAARPPLVKINDQEDITAWLKLQHALDLLVKASGVTLADGQSAVDALADANKISRTMQANIARVISSLRESMQVPKREQSETAAEANRLVGELERMAAS